MKYNNSPVALAVRKVIKLPRPDGKSLELDVRAVPIGWEIDFQRMWPMPIPPVTGTIVTKSGTEEKRDFYNKEFQVENAEWKSCHSLYFIHSALRSCPALEFSTVPTDKASVLALFKEYKEAGFSSHDLAFLAKEISEISVLTHGELKEKQDSFSLSPPKTT